MLAPPSGYEELFIANNKSTDLHTQYMYLRYPVLKNEYGIQNTV